MRSPRHKVSSVLQLKFQFAAWLLLAPLLPAQDYYQQAVAAFREARVEEAIALLEKLPADEANRPAPYNLKAVALAQLGHYEEAMAANRLAQQLDPSNANYAYNGGLILLNKKDFPQAEQAFRRAIGRFPQAAALRQGLGETLIELERYQEAERTLRDAVRVEPSSGPAHAVLAELFYLLGDGENLGMAAKKAVDLAPNHYLGHYYYGKWLLEYKDRLPESADHLGKSVELNPRFVAGWRDWGQLLGRQGQWAEAAQAYERAVAIDAHGGRLFYLLSVAYRRLGQDQKAKDALAQYRKLSEE